MLQLTKRTEYGLIALVHMADRGSAQGRSSHGNVGRDTGADRQPAVVSVREISERYPIPRRLLAEVLKDLSRAGLVESQRGASGGYALTRSPDTLTLAEIVTALEGSPALTSCEGHETGHDTCEVVPVCPIRSPLARIRTGIWNLMERTTLRSLVHASTSVPLDVPLVTTAHGARQAPDSHAPIEIRSGDIRDSA